MKFTKEQLEKAKNAKSAEELLSMAKAENVEMTVEDAKMFFTALNSQGELSDEELLAVTGGKDDENVRTVMKCANCQRRIIWIGDYLNGVAYECSICHKRSLVGVEYDG